MLTLSMEVIDYLEKKMLLPEEQNGCRRKCKGTGYPLLIDEIILRDV